jgi:hypothetical protein
MPAANHADRPPPDVVPWRLVRTVDLDLLELLLAEIALDGLVGAVGVPDHHRQALLHDSIEATPHVDFEPRDAA